MELLSKPIRTIMTKDPKSVLPNTIMTEVAAIFEQEEYHHLPVVDEQGLCQGIISKSDYYQLQDKFTHLPGRDYTKDNQLFFQTLLACNVMTKDVVTLDAEKSIEDLISVFLENKVRSVVVTEEDLAIGIVTPLDIIKYLYEDHWLQHRY